MRIALHSIVFWTMEKIKLSDYQIEELPYFKENDPNANPYKDFYKDVELLQLVYKMSHILLKKPTIIYHDVYVPSDWHICHQFAFFYNHGCLLNKENYLKRIPYEALEEFGLIEDKDDNRKNDKFWELLGKYKCDICRKYCKPEQDENLKPYKERFFTPQIIASLRAFNINIDQFWYMFLFTMDYIYGRTHHVEDYFPTPIDSFDELYSITSEIPEDEPIPHSIIDTSIILRYGKRKLKIENPDTIRLLGDIIHQFCEKHRNGYNENCDWYSKEWLDLNQQRQKIPMTVKQMFNLEDYQGWRSIKNQTSLFLFRKYMKEFFKDMKGIRNCDISEFVEDDGSEAGCAASIDIELLIARLAWAAHYLGKEKFPNDKDYLKSLLKKFKPDEHLAFGDYDWIIGTY